MFNIIKNILIITFLLAALGLAYYFFQSSSSGLSPTTTDSGIPAPSMVESELRIRQLQELRQLNISGDLFADPRFRSLVDFSQPIEPATAGRATPFLRPTNNFFDR